MTWKLIDCLEIKHGVYTEIRFNIGRRKPHWRCHNHWLCVRHRRREKFNIFWHSLAVSQILIRSGKEDVEDNPCSFRSPDVYTHMCRGYTFCVITSIICLQFIRNKYIGTCINWTLTAVVLFRRFVGFSSLELKLIWHDNAGSFLITRVCRLSS